MVPSTFSFSGTPIHSLSIYSTIPNVCGCGLFHRVIGFYVTHVKCFQMLFKDMQISHYYRIQAYMNV